MYMPGWRTGLSCCVKTQHQQTHLLRSEDLAHHFRYRASHVGCVVLCLDLSGYTDVLLAAAWVEVWVESKGVWLIAPDNDFTPGSVSAQLADVKASTGREAD
jgi:hypothetical protein